MDIGVSIQCSNSEHKNGDSCDGTARALRQKPPWKGAHKPRGSYAVFLLDGAGVDAA
jgi:hypothetical protein